MATIDQLMAAFGAFGQAAKEYGATKGIEDATMAVQELKKNTELSLQERLAAQSQITNQLQAGLAGLGAPQTQIAAAVGALAPPKVETSADALRMAQSASNPEDAKQYAQLANTFATAEGKLKATSQQEVIDQETVALSQRERDKRKWEAWYREQKPGTVSKIQEEMDLAFAKKIPEFEGDLRVQQEVASKVADSAKWFQDNKSDGGAIFNRGFVGRFAGTERTAKIDQLKSAVLPNIKKYFGGNTSNVELMETVLTSGLNEGRNNKELLETSRMMQMIQEEGLKAEQQRLEYFQEFGTLRGYNNPNDFAKMSPKQFKAKLDEFKEKAANDSMLMEDNKNQETISSVEAWLNNPANARDPRRAEAIRKLGTLKKGN